jgi:hypothetical protein
VIPEDKAGPEGEVDEGEDAGDDAGEADEE